MYRRDFIKAATVLGSSLAVARSGLLAHGMDNMQAPWFDKAMRWAQLAYVERDPGHYDPDFWLDYFKRIHADGALLSAGGVVAFYPTNIPLHYRSAWLNDTDPLGYLMAGCRKMGMSVILRTDPHAVRDNVYQAHPDWIAVTAEGEKRRHWANPELWVTCALGPYNFEFMTQVNQEIMERYEPEAIFSNRWAGHGICYCEHCQKNFRAFSGLDLPRTTDRLDTTYRKYNEWRIARLQELWFLWDEEIRKQKQTARYIPNGFPDKLITGKHSDFFFADQQARSGVIPPWANGRHAKELRATMGMKPQVGIFSVGVEERYRWKDSVQSNAEIRIWVSEGVANGLRPCFVKFGGVIFDKRWMSTVENLYNTYHRNERYLRNTAPLADVAIVYSEQTDRNYGGQPWQQNLRDHASGMYHALIEARIPFEMVSDRLMDDEHLKHFKVLILPNVAALSDAQCEQLIKYVENGGNIVGTFETSLYDAEGNQLADFGLSRLFGVSYDKAVEGPLQNSYLTIRKGSEGYHPILEGLEDAPRIINGTHRIKVTPHHNDFPSPITLVPTYPDLPMEDVFPRVPETDIREVYLNVHGKGKVAYIPWDIDRAFWQLMHSDHGRLIGNIVKWAIGEDKLIESTGAGVLDITVWQQDRSMTVHLVNLSNPMMMKGPFREILPITNQQVQVKLPDARTVSNVRLLVSQQSASYTQDGNRLNIVVDQIADHEIIGIDLS
ncbi:alpha-amylase family protein [Parapedobacter koreensis]|uniref:Beta-galactosidase trimerisation domain-containing protein n=1 Tax=Parapedobacter koreensis TaxID=332977 RepID=A0A1H7UIZ8_9SPHI|nr:alpha-amylase family protein [Parapedobacter koreensis]SEL96756.1 Beta-galactosidase trimerisation domain-containing protein [Parapedobacter koreensis]